jgi:hypothetical protein
MGEWMGCWDDDMTNVMTGIIPENSLRLASTMFIISIFSAFLISPINNQH